MKYIKTISVLSIITLGASQVSYGVPMSPQIRRLMAEKEEKMKALEQCDGKRKGWMIAGISTIGLTAVGVGVNIAQASKSNKLTNDIDAARSELQTQENKLSNINSQISQIEREKAKRERERAKADCEKQTGKWWNPDTERCEDVVKPTYVPAPEVSGPVVQPSIYDSWVLTCENHSFNFPIYPEPASDRNVARLQQQCEQEFKGVWDTMTAKTGTGEIAMGTTFYVCRDMQVCDDNKVDKPGKVNPITGLDSVKPVTIAGADNDSGLRNSNASSDHAGPWDISESGEPITELTPIKLGTLPGADSDSGLRNSNASSDHVGPWDISESDCYQQVEDYLALNCKKCNSLWEDVGEETCEQHIDKHQGFSRVEQYEVVMDRNGDPDYTSLRIFAKDGYNSILNCNGVCGDFDSEASKACRISGGEWRYSAAQRNWECHCGTIGSYTDRHMALTNGKTCTCQRGYVLIDENQPIKGCRLGSDDVAIDNVIRKANTVTAKWQAVSTKVRQCELAAKNVEGAINSNQAETYFDQTRKFANEAMSLVKDVKNSYSEFITAYNELSSNDKKSVEKDKESADIIKGDVVSVQSTVDAYVKKATDNFARVVEAENAKTKAQQKQNDAAILAQKCLDTHGMPNGTSCSCDSKKNLLPDGPNACKCKTVGKNRYEWHDKCGMCRAPSAVDKDLPCYP